MITVNNQSNFQKKGKEGLTNLLVINFWVAEHESQTKNEFEVNYFCQKLSNLNVTMY